MPCQFDSLVSRHLGRILAELRLALAREDGFGLFDPEPERERLRQAIADVERDLAEEEARVASMW